jgi:RND family efflux transporter MFP subunit
MNRLAKRLAGAPILAVVVLAALGSDAAAQELPERAAGMDANKNGVIDRDEARGPLASNFDAMDRDKSGGIDGAELAAFFGGGGGGTAVVADAVIEGDLSQTTPVIGQLVARQVGPVAARVSGPIESVRVQVGDHVKKGDILVVVSTDRLQSETDRNLAVVEQKQAMVVIAEAELEKLIQEQQRIDNLRESSAYSQKRRDDVVQDVAMKRGSLANRNAELAQAVEQLNRANIDLRDAAVRAPYDGVVTAKNTEVGSYVGVGSPVVMLINQNTLEIEVQVPTNRLGGLQRGEALQIALDDGTRHEAVIRAVVPEENPLTRTRAVRLTPDFGDVHKQPALNQSVTVSIPIGGSGKVMTVHKDAVTRDEGRPLVFVINAGRVEQRSVVLGESVGQRFTVISGLRVGEQVVVRGNEQLSSGAAVRVVSQTGSVPTAQRTN